MKQKNESVSKPDLEFGKLSTEVIKKIMILCYRMFQCGRGEPVEYPIDVTVQVSLVGDVLCALKKGCSTPPQIHEYRVKDMAAQGLAFGERIDPDKRTHPKMVPYEQLSALEKSRYQAMVAAREAAVMLVSDIREFLQDELREQHHNAKFCGLKENPGKTRLLEMGMWTGIGRVMELVNRLLETDPDLL